MYVGLYLEIIFFYSRDFSLHNREICFLNTFHCELSVQPDDGTMMDVYYETAIQHQY